MTGTTGETNNHRVLVVALRKCDPGPENDDSDEKSTNSASGQKKHTHPLTLKKQLLNIGEIHWEICMRFYWEIGTNFD